MADIELVIKIPEEAKRAFDCAESNDIKGSFYDHGGVIGKAIKNGTLLPKRHGRLIDADRLKAHFVGTEQGTDLEVYLESTIIDAPTIIEADEAESGDKEE